MTQQFNQKSIEDRFKNLEKRLIIIEGEVKKLLLLPEEDLPKRKDITLAELRRKSEIKNGQQSVALIIGYYEKVLKEEAIKPKDIESGWRDGKFSGKYNPNFLIRAIKEGLVRPQKEGVYDLSGTGEDFFDAQIKKTQ